MDKYGSGESTQMDEEELLDCKTAAMDLRESIEKSKQFWGVEQYNTEIILANRLKCLPSEPNESNLKAATILAHKAWNAMTQNDLEELSLINKSLYLNGQIATNILTPIISKILDQTVGEINIKTALNEINSNSFEAIVLFANQLLNIFCENEPPKIVADDTKECEHQHYHNRTSEVSDGIKATRVRNKNKDRTMKLKDIPERIKYMLAYAKENGLDIKVTNLSFVNERSKLAMIERQIRGALKLKRAYENKPNSAIKNIKQCRDNKRKETVSHTICKHKKYKINEKLDRVETIMPTKSSDVESVTVCEDLLEASSSLHSETGVCDKISDKERDKKSMKKEGSLLTLNGSAEDVCYRKSRVSLGSHSLVVDNKMTNIQDNLNVKEEPAEIIKRNDLSLINQLSLTDDNVNKNQSMNLVQLKSKTSLKSKELINDSSISTSINILNFDNGESQINVNKSDVSFKKNVSDVNVPSCSYAVNEISSKMNVISGKEILDDTSARGALKIIDEKRRKLSLITFDAAEEVRKKVNIELVRNCSNNNVIDRLASGELNILLNNQSFSKLSCTSKLVNVNDEVRRLKVLESQQQQNPQIEQSESSSCGDVSAGGQAFDVETYELSDLIQTSEKMTKVVNNIPEMCKNDNTMKVIKDDVKEEKEEEEEEDEDEEEEVDEKPITRRLSTINAEHCNDNDNSSHIPSPLVLNAVDAQTPEIEAIGDGELMLDNIYTVSDDDDDDESNSTADESVEDEEEEENCSEVDGNVNTESDDVDGESDDDEEDEEEDEEEDDSSGHSDVIHDEDLETEEVVCEHHHDHDHDHDHDHYHHHHHHHHHHYDEDSGCFCMAESSNTSSQNDNATSGNNGTDEETPPPTLVLSSTNENNVENLSVEQEVGNVKENNTNVLEENQNKFTEG